MNQVLSSIFCILCIASLSAQTARTTLIEVFTEANCSACAQLNSSLDAFSRPRQDSLIILRYAQPSDIFYQRNSAELDAIATYYSGVSALPEALIDGNAYRLSPGLIDSSLLATRYTDSAFIELDLQWNWLASGDFIDINCTIYNRGTTQFFTGRKLRIALVEDSLYFPHAPGSNGQQLYYSYVKEFVEGHAGRTIPVIAVGAQHTESYRIARPQGLFSLRELAFVAFVQNDNTREIFQAAYASPQALPAALSALDMGFAPALAGNSVFCERIAPELQLYNAGADTIFEAELAYRLNGGAWQPAVFSGVLAPADTSLFSFADTSLAAANYSLDFQLLSLNAGQQDHNSLNEQLGSFSFVIMQLRQDSSFQEGFEGYAPGTSFPAGAFLASERDYGSRVGIIEQAGQAFGGFGQSQASYTWNFWDLEPGARAKLIFPPVDFSLRQSSVLNFSYAYKQASGSQDSLFVYLSEDCGASWQRLWSKGGEELADQGTENGNRFYPQNQDWQRAAIALDSFAARGELLFAFEGLSDFGNSLYLDDIQLLERSLVAVQAQERKEPKLLLYPNPTSEHIFIAEYGLADEALCTLYNSLGQALQELRLGQLRTEGLSLQNYASGLYILRIETGAQNLFAEIIKK